MYPSLNKDTNQIGHTCKSVQRFLRCISEKEKEKKIQHLAVLRQAKLRSVSAYTLASRSHRRAQIV